MSDDIEWTDPQEQEEKDLRLHVAKMCEHMEWESTLPELEKSRRRLPKAIGAIGRAAQVAAECDMPWVLLGQIERIVYHIGVLWGDDWMEKASQQREDWFNEDDEYEANDFLE